MNDPIERADAINEIVRWKGYLDEDMISRIQIGLKKLPSAQSEKRTEKRTETHARDLIDRQALLARIDRIVRVNHLDRCKVWFTPAGAKTLVSEQPTIEPERKSGKWIEDAETYYKAINAKGGGVCNTTPYFVDAVACSECLTMFSVIDNCTEMFEFCPNCGAKMEVQSAD